MYSIDEMRKTVVIEDYEHQALNRTFNSSSLTVEA